MYTESPVNYGVIISLAKNSFSKWDPDDSVSPSFSNGTEFKVGQLKCSLATLTTLGLTNYLTSSTILTISSSVS